MLMGFAALAVGAGKGRSVAVHAEPGETARRLGLQPHSEGGWFRRTWTSPVMVEGDRPAATLIYFLLHPGEASAWHVLDAQEIWLWHGPGKLRLQLAGTRDKPTVTERPLILGPPTTALFPSNQGGPEPNDSTQGRPESEVTMVQALVPAGTWQCTDPVEEEILVSCLVSPGFTYEGFRLLG